MDAFQQKNIKFPLIHLQKLQSKRSPVYKRKCKKCPAKLIDLFGFCEKCNFKFCDSCLTTMDFFGSSAQVCLTCKKFLSETFVIYDNKKTVLDEIEVSSILDNIVRDCPYMSSHFKEGGGRPYCDQLFLILRDEGDL